RQDVAPAAAKLGAPLRGLENLGSFECRGRDRVRGATLSEHGRADALDVHSFKLANGRTLVLADPRVPADFRNAVRASACARFMTVLGPGSDSDHAEHVHIDLEPRRNDYKICEWDVREPAPQAEGTPIPIDEVPLPRPRPIAANVSR
ncbi:MAG TPA: extensin family protein, partial [Xanthobacteraceae bacterium]|nr:extensin family protein [Xanthobacteraceae bacterium]